MSDYAAQQTTHDVFMRILQKRVILDKDNGTVTQKDTAEFFDSLKNELKQYGSNELTSVGKTGLEELLEQGSNTITDIKTDSGHRAKDIMAQDKTRYDDALKRIATLTVRRDTDIVTPTITELEANELVDRHNTNIRRILGIKEACKEHIVVSFGAPVTNSHILKPNSNKEKNLDDISLYELMTSLSNNAERSSFDSTFNGVIGALTTPFDWQQSAETNMDKLVTASALLEPMGIIIPKALIALVMMKNLEKTTKSGGTWAEDLKICFKTLRNMYTIDHKHDDTTLKEMLVVLYKADKNRTISDAPPPDDMGVDEAHAVYDSYIDAMLEESDTESEVETDPDEKSVAYSASSDSDSSVDTKSARRALKEKEKRKATRKTEEKKKKEKEAKAKTKAKDKNRQTKKGTKGIVNRDCKHCTKHRRFASHPDTPEKKCRFNPKAKVWRQKWVAELLGVDYKLRELFAEEDGGYPPLDDSDTSTGSESN